MMNNCFKQVLLWPEENMVIRTEQIEALKKLQFLHHWISKHLNILFRKWQIFQPKK